MKYFNFKLASLGAIVWGSCVSASYYFCEDIPIEFISQAENCGNYSNFDILLLGTKQGIYAFFMTGPLSKFCDLTKDKTNSLVSTMTGAAITTSLTYANHQYLVQSENPLQPTIMGGFAAIIAYGLISERKNILGKVGLENLFD